MKIGRKNVNRQKTYLISRIIENQTINDGKENRCRETMSLNKSQANKKMQE